MFVYEKLAAMRWEAVVIYGTILISAYRELATPQKHNCLPNILSGSIQDMKSKCYRHRHQQGPENMPQMHRSL